MEDLCVVGFGDSSVANAEEERTQVGIILAVTTPKARYGTALASIVDWRRLRTHRRVRSTLSAEAIACDAVTVHSYFACSWLDEVVHNRRATTARKMGQKHRTPMLICTDCESLHDAMQKVSPSPGEKRTLIDVLSIMESLGEHTGSRLCWIPMFLQRSDGLTKGDTKLRAMLASFMGRSLVQLRDEASQPHA